MLLLVLCRANAEGAYRRYGDARIGSEGLTARIFWAVVSVGFWVFCAGLNGVMSTGADGSVVALTWKWGARVPFLLV